MPSRQGRLDASYFSQPSTSQSNRGPKRTGRASRQETALDDDEDSEGSAGMAAIRLSESPNKSKPSSSRATRVGDNDEDGGSEDDVQLLSPNKMGKGRDKPAESHETGSEQDQEQDDQTLVEGELDATTLMGEGGGPAPTAEPDHDEAETTITAQRSSDSADRHAPLPRKRVSLASSLRAAGPPVGKGPQPKAHTRLRTAPTRESSAASSESSIQLIPYIELESWPATRKATYTMLGPVRNGRERHVAFEASPASAIHQALMPEVMEISDDDEIEVISPPVPEAGPSKRQRILAVELPSSQRSGAGKSGQSERVLHAKDATDHSTNSRSTPTEGKSKLKPDFRKRDVVEKRRQTHQSESESDDEINDIVPLSRAVAKGKAKAQAENSKIRARHRDPLESDSEREFRRPPQAAKKAKTQAAHSRSPGKSAKKRRVSISSDEREEMLSEIKMDEPKRFKSQSRLRKKKETAFQRKLRKLKEKRQGIVGSDTDSQDDESEDGDEDDETSDSAPDSIEEDFIEEDGGVVADGVLPHEFSLNSAQTPEWKFKVVFHYFVLLVVEGVDILPLKGSMKEYMVPQLEDLRRKIEDFRDQRVRSQIWPHSLVNALKAYPEIHIASLEFAEEHCFACNRTNWKSRFRVDLKGDKYDRNTYESKVKRRERVRKAKARNKKKPKKQNGRRSSSSSRSDADGSSSDSDSESDSDEEGDPNYYLGTHCKKRTHVYHQMAHWERDLYMRIKRWYHDLLRANGQDVSEDDSEASSGDIDGEEDASTKADRRQRREAKRDETTRRIKRLKADGGVPKEYDNVDVVTEWMDRQGHILSELKWMEDLQEQSRRLEFEGNRDE